VSAPVRSEFGFHVIRFDELRPGQEQPFESVREELATEYRTREAEREFNERANKLAERAFDAYNELATVAAEMQLQVKTVAGFPRTGTRRSSRTVLRSCRRPSATTSSTAAATARSSSLRPIACSCCASRRTRARDRALEAVHDRIKEQLTRARAQELAEAAAHAFLHDLEQGLDAAQALQRTTASGTPRP